MKQRREGCRVRGIGSRNGERNERKESVKKGLRAARRAKGGM